jgi:hypothetical protein
MSDLKEIDCQLYIPRLLYLRISRREMLKIVIYTSLIINIGLFILGFIFLDGVSNTRRYIYNGDQFWDISRVNNYKDNELQLFMSVIAIFTILASFFEIMNSSVIYYHAQYGGLTKRLVLTQLVNKVFQILILILSIISIIKFTNIIILFPIYLALAAVGEISSIFVFYFLRKVIRKELTYMLPYETMLIHKEEYYQEFLTKTRARIDPKNAELLNNDFENKNTARHNDEKMFMKN